MKQRGVSLVELMMALAIGSFLIAGTITVYVQASAAYAVNETIARLQETARFALSTLELDIRLAGYWGLTSDGAHIKGGVGNAPLALSSRGSSCGADFPLNLQRPLEGRNNSYGLPCSASAGGAQAGSDVLIVRHAEPESVPASSERLQIYTNRDDTADTVFLSSTAPGSAGEVHDLNAHAYYIARGSTGQAGLPSLRRKILQGGPSIGPNIVDEEVMAGVEDLQVQFGIEIMDVDSADRFTRYVNPGDTALGSAVVVAARIWLRVRSETPEPGYVDNKIYDYADANFRPAGTPATYRRLLVSKTIHLRNAGSFKP